VVCHRASMRRTGRLVGRGLGCRSLVKHDDLGAEFGLIRAGFAAARRGPRETPRCARRRPAPAGRLRDQRTERPSQLGPPLPTPFAAASSVPTEISRRHWARGAPRGARKSRPIAAPGCSPGVGCCCAEVGCWHVAGCCCRRCDAADSPVAAARWARMAAPGWEDCSAFPAGAARWTLAAARRAGADDPACGSGTHAAAPPPGCLPHARAPAHARDGWAWWARLVAADRSRPAPAPA